MIFNLYIDLLTLIARSVSNGSLLLRSLYANMAGKLDTFVIKALESEGLNNCRVEVCGGNEKGEGYIGDITFVDVFSEKQDEGQKKYSLVVKIGGKHKIFCPIVRLGFEREIHIYAHVLPAFRKLQTENNVTQFASIPKCYLTILNDKQEVIVLENLKDIGYQLYDRKTPMNLVHMNLVMKVLGEWHALSYSLRDQNPEEFKKLTINWKCPAMEMYVNSHIGKWLNISQNHLYKVLGENNEYELLKNYKEKIGNKLATDLVKEILNANDAQSVIVHGDCWNNNLMFLYEDNASSSNPTKVSLLDFQISTLASPVIDLSYFIYGVSSVEELVHVEDLLKTYYFSISHHIKELGSDPEKLFSYSVLLKHWKKYSVYGALIHPLLVCDSLVDKDDAASYGDKNYDYESIIKSVDENHKEAVTSRLIAVAKHFTYFDV